MSNHRDFPLDPTDPTVEIPLPSFPDAELRNVVAFPLDAWQRFYDLSTREVRFAMDELLTTHGQVRKSVVFRDDDAAH